MGKLSAVLRLTRIEHSVILVIAVIAAELIVSVNGQFPSPLIETLSLVTPVFISMGAFAINDYFDIKVDKINKKMRPLVTGELKPADALYTTAFCMLVGLGASYFINLYCFLIAILFALIAILYSYKLKELLFWGNAYVAFTGAVPFIFGNYVTGTTLKLVIVVIALMAFIASLAREIEGTIRDYKGDVKMRNVTTIPRVIGKKEAAYLSLLLYLISIALSAYLFVAVKPFLFNFYYGIIVLIADIIFIYVGAGYITKKSQRFFASARNLSLLAMGISLISFLLAPLI